MSAVCSQPMCVGAQHSDCLRGEEEEEDEEVAPRMCGIMSNCCGPCEGVT